MKKVIASAIVLSFAATPVLAQEPVYEGGYNPNLTFEQYEQLENPHLQQSQIFIFTNGEPCYGCPETINLITQIYNQNYQNLYQLQQINYQTDTEYNYQQTYNLSQPLEIVLVKNQYGENVGYKKLYNLQFQSDDPVSFQETFITDVNSYLGEE